MKSIFISSTFKDMNAERDLVLARVIPDIQIEAKKYGEYVNAIDLRWGVDTMDLESDEGSRKILDICFEEIDKSSPYMLIFLGERYGWIPEESIVRNAVENHTKDFIIEDYRKSVTALEIEYGMLSEKIGNPEKCVVCFRNLEQEADYVYSAKKHKGTSFVENEEAKQKLRQLKEKIRQRFGDRVIEYTGKWDFLEGRVNGLDTLDGEYLDVAITKAFLNIFKQEWEQRSIRNQIEQEERFAEAFYEKKIIPFRGREELIEKYYKKLEEDDSVLLLRGEDGSGKSSFICKVAERAKQAGNVVYTFFAGISEGSCTVSDFLKRAVYFLEDVTGEHHREFLEDTQLQIWFWELCNQLKQPVYFCVDGLEQLLPKVNEKSIISFVKLFPEKTNMMLTCGGNSYYKDVVLSRKEIVETEFDKTIRIETIPNLKVAERISVVEGIAESFGKTVNGKVVTAIEKKIFNSAFADKGMQTPLYLSLIMKRLNMMDYEELKDASDEDSLIHKSIEIVENMPDRIGHAAYDVIYEGCNRLVNRFSPLYGLWETLDKVCSLISFTKAGIDQEGIDFINTKGILKGMYFGHKRKILFNTYDANALSWFWNYMDDFFVIRKGGYIDCVNETFRYALQSQNPFWLFQLAIIEYADTLDKNNLFRMREGLYQAAQLIQRDTIRIVQNLSREKTEEMSKGDALRKLGIDEEWVYRKASGFFEDYAKYKNPEMKRTMSGLPSGFYIKYLDKWFTEDRSEWKVKRELLVYLLTDYPYYDEKLGQKIQSILLEEAKAGREDTELMLLFYEWLYRGNKSYAVQCFNYSEKLYLQDKTWENAKRMWKYCVDVTQEYKYQYLKEKYEKNPEKRAIYQSDLHKEVDKRQYEDIMQVAEEMYQICLEYQAMEEAGSLWELMQEIRKMHGDEISAAGEGETVWRHYYSKIMEQIEKKKPQASFLEKWFDEVYAIYRKMYEMHDKFSVEVKNNLSEEMMKIFETIMHMIINEKQIDILNRADKMESLVLDFICTYAEYVQNTGERLRMRSLDFLRAAARHYTEYADAGYEFKYLDVETLEQIIEVLSVSWSEFIEFIEAE